MATAGGSGGADTGGTDAERMMLMLINKLNEQQQQQQQHRDEMKQLLESVKQGNIHHSSFPPFDGANELWSDYYTRFLTFLGANSIPEGRRAQIFLTNQSPVVYKLLTNLAKQQTPSKEVNDLSFDEITEFMREQYDPKLFVVRERFQFWRNMQRKPGESIQELAARIRHEAGSCDFSSITDPLYEALRTRFMCCVNNEAVLKSLFKFKDDELTFAKAVQVAIDTEGAAQVAKETVDGSSSKAVCKLKQRVKNTETKSSKEKINQKNSTNNTSTEKKIECYRCGREHYQECLPL